MNLYNKLYTNYQKIIDSKPVVLNLTNSVTQDFMANALLAIGASPIMSDDESEISELITIAGSVNINIGTLNQRFNGLVLNAAKLSQQLHKPLILDPVGAGATSSRTNLALQLLPYSTIIRGNASEIMALGGAASATAGVDTRHETSNAKHIGQILAEKYSNTIVISGKTDLVISGDNVFINQFGDQLMTVVTGAGCVLSSIIAAFAAVNEDYALTSHLAVVFYTLCAEKAMTIATTPSKFKVEFIDALYAPDWTYIKQKLSQNI